MVKDWKVARLGEAVLLPLALAFTGGCGQASGTQTCGCLWRMGEAMIQGQHWEQRKLRKHLFSVLSPEPRGDQKGHKEQAASLAFSSPCLYFPTECRPHSTTKMGLDGIADERQEGTSKSSALCPRSDTTRLGTAGVHPAVSGLFHPPWNHQGPPTKRPPPFSYLPQEVGDSPL